MTVYQDLAFRQVVEARDEMSEGRLAAARSPDKGNPGTGGHVYADVPQSGVNAIVAEGDVSELDAANGPTAVFGARKVVHGRLGVQDQEVRRLAIGGVPGGIEDYLQQEPRLV